MEKDKEAIKDKIVEELESSGLNDQQRDFIMYYLESYNATQSYLKAYPEVKSRNTAKINAYRLLHTEDVKAEMKKLRKLLSVAYNVDPTQYLDFLLRSANSDMGDYVKFAEEEVPIYDKDGMQLVDPETGDTLTRKVNKMHLVDSSLVDTSLITGIKQGKDGITITLVDKSRSWEKLKEFFEWRKEKEDKANFASNILDALRKRTSELWQGEEDDLESIIKE